MAAYGAKHCLSSFSQCLKDGEGTRLGDGGVKHRLSRLVGSIIQGIEKEIIYHVPVVVVICALLLINLLHLTSYW
jgi:hypothetical protein